MCVFIISNPCGVRRSDFDSMQSGIPVFPASCMGLAKVIVMIIGIFILNTRVLGPGGPSHLRFRYPPQAGEQQPSDRFFSGKLRVCNRLNWANSLGQPQLMSCRGGGQAG